MAVEGKAVINGFRYDSTKAIEVGTYDSRHSASEFQGWAATLYKTVRKGYFFLVGEGGPMTQFGEKRGDARTYGKKIIPMTNDIARNWAEQYLDFETVCEHFELEDA